MSNVPLQLLVAIVAGWISQHQQGAIEFLREENRMLREKLGPKRILRPIPLNQGQRAGAGPGLAPGQLGMDSRQAHSGSGERKQAPGTSGRLGPRRTAGGQIPLCGGRSFAGVALGVSGELEPAGLPLGGTVRGCWGARARWPDVGLCYRSDPAQTPCQGSAEATSVSIVWAVVCAISTPRAPDKSDTAERLLISL
jgi:hypothetical protein